MIENALECLAPQGEDACSQAVRYALLNGGKRFRPRLTLSTVSTLNGDVEKAVIPACAIEMIHCYSLIHDDLPCMDDDDFRRGKPTVHKAFSEGIAVLAGDWLLTHAFEAVANAPDLSAEQRLLLIQILAHRAGGKGMIGGQVADLSMGKKSLDELKQLHGMKTGALITASVEFGCVIACGEVIESYRTFGENLGLAFQIVDDILDVTNSVEKHGQAVSSDLINGKTTYISLMGLDGAREAAEFHLEKAIAAAPSMIEFGESLRAALSI